MISSQTTSQVLDDPSIFLALSSGLLNSEPLVAEWLHFLNSLIDNITPI